jgi:tellurite resistance protein TerC
MDSSLATAATAVHTTGTPLLYSIFVGAVLAVLVADLVLFHRKAHAIGFREALLWTIFWVGLAMGFNVWLYFEYGSKPALEFLAGYVIEQALSVDNLFVFLVIFDYFAVPSAYQHRVLFWGILGAVILRGVFIALGTALVASFHWVFYIFAAFLIYTGIRILLFKDSDMKPEDNPVVKFFRRFVPMTTEYHGQKFLVRHAGKLLATPLLLVVAVVEATDVVFAVDSIPAIFAVTTDPFLVFTSNIFAILGLRSLFFLIANLMDRFHYLQYGLGLVLSFVGIKMLIKDWYEIPIGVSLLVIGSLLTSSILLSWFRPEKAEEP